MRNKTSLTLCIAALGVFSATIAGASPIPRAIQARYTSLIAAMMKFNMPAYDAYYATEYVSVDPAGKTSHRDQYLKDIHDLVKGGKKFAFKIKYGDAKTHNGMVDVPFECTGTISTATGATTFHEIGQDTWKKIGKDWFEVKTVDKVMDVTTPKAKSASQHRQP